MKTHYPPNSLSGFSTISMVIILTIIGLLLLTGFHSLIISEQKTIISQTQYYQRFNQASSALQWAITQNWPTPTDQWQCLIEARFQLKACIKKSLLKIDDYILVRGEAEHFYLYQLTLYDNHKLISQSGHWLDYCPEKRSIDCE